MKNILLLAWLILFSINPPLTAQKIILKGQVSIHNSKYETGKIEYVPNAYASAPFAGSDDTDEMGKFELTFIGMDEGTSVKVIIEKAGLEIVNKKDLQDVVIGRLTPLKIYLAPKGQLAKAQVELFNVNIKSLTKRYDHLIANLQKADDESQHIIKDLEKKLNVEISDRFEAEKVLKEQLEKTKRRLPEFIQGLTKVNLDFTTEMYRKAYQYLKAGEIEKAIEIIDEEVLDKQAKESVKVINQIKLDISNLNAAFTNNEAELEKLVESYYLQALSLEENGYKKAAIDTLYSTIQLLPKITKGKNNRNRIIYSNAASYFQKEGELAKEFYALQRAIQVAGIQSEELLVLNTIWEEEIIYLMVIGKIKENKN